MKMISSATSLANAISWVTMIMVVFWSARPRITFNTSPVSSGSRADVGSSKQRISGGQQQRVAIARAIVTHPKLLLADEPTGSLDSHRSVEIMKLLQKLNDEEGITVVLVTHEPDMAKYAKRIVHFVDGTVASDQENKPC